MRFSVAKIALVGYRREKRPFSSSVDAKTLEISWLVGSAVCDRDREWRDMSELRIHGQI